MTQAATYQVPSHPSGLEMRTLVNTIIRSILTDNAGPTPPPETYPGMWWGDTTAVRLRRRNNANTAWADIGPLDDFIGDVRRLAEQAAPPGTVVMWWGDGNRIPTGWLRCDGTNGTPDLRDRVPYGAGGSMGQGYGGNNTVTLGVHQMPHHAHGVYDPGHGHGVGDPGHAHGVADGGHNHPLQDGGWGQAGMDNGGVTAASGPNQYGQRGAQWTHITGANIGIYGAGTGIWIGGSGTGIGIYGEGGNQPFDNRPAFCALWFIMKQ